MKMWKLVSGIVSMLASAAVLTSVIASFRDLGGTTAQPRGLVSLGIGALCLGLAGIFHVVFRDGIARNISLATIGLYAAAFVFFLFTAFAGRFDTAGWIQILTLLIWSAGCAALSYLELSWTAREGEREPSLADMAERRRHAKESAKEREQARDEESSLEVSPDDNEDLPSESPADVEDMPESAGQGEDIAEESSLELTPDDEAPRRRGRHASSADTASEQAGSEGSSPELPGGQAPLDLLPVPDEAAIDVSELDGPPPRLDSLSDVTWNGAGAPPRMP